MAILGRHVSTSALGAHKIKSLNTTKDSTRRAIIKSLCIPYAKANELETNFRSEIEFILGKY